MVNSFPIFRFRLLRAAAAFVRQMANITIPASGMAGLWTLRGCLCQST
jgi:hypothetical protein